MSTLGTSGRLPAHSLVEEVNKYTVSYLECATLSVVHLEMLTYLGAARACCIQVGYTWFTSSLGGGGGGLFPKKMGGCAACSGNQDNTFS